MSFRRRMAITATAVPLLATFLAGCDDDEAGSAPPPATSNPPSLSPEPGPNKADASLPDPCTLLTRQDAGALLKKPIQNVKPDNKDGERGCDYDDSLSLFLSNTTKANFDSEAEGYQEVPGVGDGAYNVSGVLWVRHDTTKIVVIAGGGNEARAAIARKVIEKLP